jgi:hypothetical protein
MLIEYVLGFGFGWTVFQALFMRDMVGGSYERSLKTTFAPELLSMNLLMTGMLPTIMILKKYVASPERPASASFWFVMSMGLLVGFVVSYPMNWWLVANHLKHGMMTVRPAGTAAAPHYHAASEAMGEMPDDEPMPGMTMSKDAHEAPRPSVVTMALLSFLALFAGAAFALWL